MRGARWWYRGSTDTSMLSERSGQRSKAQGPGGRAADVMPASAGKELLSGWGRAGAARLGKGAPAKAVGSTSSYLH